MKLVTGFLLIGTIGALAADPSSKPVADPTGKTKYSERHRILVDLDDDGAADMLLSGGPQEFGTMGGPWTVHLNRDGDYKAIGEVWAHPSAIAFEPDRTRISSDDKTHRFSRVWVYLKGGGSAGSLGYYRIGKQSVDRMSSIEIYPGDGGSDLGSAIYEATFKQSPIPFTIQRSTTAEDGAVTWHESER